MAQIIRAHETSRFTIVSNATLRDPRLSFRATGVLARLLSEPPDSAINTSVLWRERRPHGEGRDALLTALSELESAGYLQRRRSQDHRGRWRTDWIVSSVPAGTSVDVAPDSVLVAGPTWPTHDVDRDVDHIAVDSPEDTPDAQLRAEAC